MKNVKRILLASVFVFAGHSTSTFAAEVASVQCDTCVTDAQFTSESTKHAILNQLLLVNVMNFKNYDIRKFEVSKTTTRECESEGEPDGRGGYIEYCRTRSHYTSIPKNVTSNEYTNFIELADAINDANKYIAQYSIKVPGDIAATGWDIVAASYKRGQVFEYFNTLPASKNIIEKSLVALAAASKIGATGPLKFDMPPIPFDFADGSTGYAVVDFVAVDGTVNFKFVLLYDKDKNKVDLKTYNPFTTQKIFNFSPDSTAAFKSFLTILGAYGLTTTTYTGSSVPTGSVIVTVCTSGKVCPSPN